MDNRRVALTLGGRTDAVQLQSFLSAVETFTHLLGQLDRQLSGESQATLDWVITNLESGSATVEAEAQPRNETLDFARLVIRRLGDGLATVEKLAERPAGFTDEMLDTSKRLVSVLNDGVSRVVVRTSGKQVTLTQHLAANVDTLIGPRYDSLGAVEGTLESVSLHGRPTFNVYDRLHGRRVRCDFALELLENVKHALGRRVLVRGVVRSSAHGEPISIHVDEIRTFPERSGQPGRHAIVGLDPNFTGEASAADYVSERRDS